MLALGPPNATLVNSELLGLGPGLGTQLIFLGNKYASIFYFLIRVGSTFSDPMGSKYMKVMVFKYEYEYF